MIKASQGKLFTKLVRNNGKYMYNYLESMCDWCKVFNGIITVQGCCDIVLFALFVVILLLLYSSYGQRNR